jgi:iron complex outermembrane recepter protein
MNGLAFKGAGEIGYGNPVSKQSRLGGLSAVALMALSAPAWTQESTQLPSISVTASPTETNNSPATTNSTPEGSAASGYKFETLKSVGPWGTRSILDTPYSTEEIGEAMIVNTISDNTDHVFQMTPSVQLAQPYEFNGLERVMIRGFLVQNQLTNGIQGNTNGQGVFVQNISRIEILNGLSGFLYGVGNVGGTLNFITKPPLDAPYHQLTIGDYGGGQAFTTVDLGGPLEGVTGMNYRLNALVENGDTTIKNQSSNRYMFSGAVDWSPLDNLVIGVNGMVGHDRMDGRVAQWTFLSTLTAIPRTPNQNYLWASPTTFNQDDTDRFEVNIKYKFNDMLSFRGAYAYQLDQRQEIIQSNRITSLTTYTANPGVGGADNMAVAGGYAYADVKLNTFGIANTFTLGFNQYASTDYNAYYNGNSYVLLGSARSGLSLNNPDSANVPLPSFDVGNAPKQIASRVTNTNYVLADDIRFNEHFEILAGVNDSNYTVENYDYGGAFTDAPYAKGALTPSVSLIVKPTSFLTAYGSYIQSLEQGATVSNSSGVIYTNNGQVFAPMLSEQYEAGVKAEVRGLLLTAAVFDIEKANTYSQDNGNSVYTMYQDGLDRHRGLEFTVSGKLNEDLTVWGGLTLQDARVIKSSNNATLGLMPQGVSPVMIKLYEEYCLPFFSNLFLTGGVYYTGSSYINALNTQLAPGYVIGDLGLRYMAKLAGYDTVFRLNVTNIADTRYWMTNWTIGAMSGAPRTVSLSASIKF